MAGSFCKIHPGSIKIAHASHSLIGEIKKNKPPLETKYVSVEMDVCEICACILESEVEELELLFGRKFDKDGRLVLPLDEEWRQDIFSKRIGLMCWMCLQEYRDARRR